MHPNPSVVAATRAELVGHPGINITKPLDYPDFVHLLRHAWLVLSDSGGIQEEAPSLGKPVLVLRDNTERPEGLQAGTAFLVGSKNGALSAILERAYESPEWLSRTKRTPNPFGDGLAGKRIASLIQRELSGRRGQRDSVGL
jgi:UDP-N-acetylglucosamine 2-epimerase (non-hydrolysing)